MGHNIHVKKVHTTPFMEHLELLEEWNEETSFYATHTTIHMTQLGVMVVQDVECRTRLFDNKGTFTGLSKEAEMIQVCAVYGDEDELKRLVIFDNGETDDKLHTRTQVVVNDGPIRG